MPLSLRNIFTQALGLKTSAYERSVFIQIALTFFTTKFPAFLKSRASFKVSVIAEFIW